MRHGETDFNSQPNIKLTHHPREISLNSTGRIQVSNISLTIQRLNIQFVYTSPLNRVQETYDILFPEKKKKQIIVNEFEECDVQTWTEMTRFKISTLQVSNFINQVNLGLKKIFSNCSPALIIAHGGTHWAICYLLNVKKYDWIIGNCKLSRFYLDNNSEWKASSNVRDFKNI